jgi:hypothetical protein
MIKSLSQCSKIEIILELVHVVIPLLVLVVCFSTSIDSIAKETQYNLITNKIKTNPTK